MTVRNDSDDWSEQAAMAETDRSLTGEANLDSILQALMECLLRTRDPVAYLAAVRTMADATPEAGDELRAGLQAMARALWNVTPLPWQDFRRRPLPKPERNAPCPCGSGRKFKQCCRKVSANLGFITPILGEMLLARSLREKDFRAAESHGGPLLKLALAQHAIEDGHPGRGKRILTRLLDKPLKDDLLEADAIDALGAAYLELGQTHAAMAAMRRIVETRRGASASAAYRVLATMAMEDDEFEVALRLARHALDASADNPMAGMVEIQALLMLDRFEEVGERLAHWRQRARQLDDPMMAQMFEELADKVADLETRLREAMAADSPEAWREAIDAASREPLRPVTAAPGPDIEAGRPSVFLTPAPEVVAAEQPLFEQDPDAVDLLAWLTAHPLGLQSPDALERVLQQVPPDGPVAALRDHRLRLIEHWLAQVPDGALLPWGWIEQRGILRTLFRVGLDAEEDDDIDLAIRCFERVLALEPDDHVGARLVLVNLLLREGRDAEALAWIERYPSSYLPELAFGKVLAHARLGQVKAAEAAFREAHAQLPNVLPFLKAANKKPPQDLNPGMVRVGGEDQAWFYREDMRPSFAAERGLLAFLDGIAKRMQQGR
ncbi:MAG: hypothetical protein EA417_18120 [Gammaproteobacteria bacterium]|nr:MAG: hypothetical protein EA417_18120 [Gammaproteobacteria bacterium]